MIGEVTYLSEVKLRNQVRRDVIAHKVGETVADKSQQYKGGYIHVESVVGHDGWYEIRYSGRRWDNETMARKNAKISLRLSQVLHLCGYEIKFVERRAFMSSEMEIVTLYRKRA